MRAANIWDGGGANDNWSTALNWDNNAVPAFPQPLTFSGNTRLTPNNDLAALTVQGISFTGATGAFTVGGNAITLTSGITNTSAFTQTVNLPLTLSGANTFDASGAAIVLGGTLNLNGAALTVQGASNTTINGLVSGSGSLTKNSGGNLTFANPVTFNGGVALNAGTITANNGFTVSGGTFTGSGTLAGSLTYSSTTGGFSVFGGQITGGGSTVTINNLGAGGALAISNANSYGGLTTINSGGVLKTNNTFGLGTTAGGTLVQSGGSLVLEGVAIGNEALAINGSGNFNFGDTRGALVATGGGASSYAGAITVQSNATIGVDGGSTLTLTGGIAKNGTTLTFTTTAGAQGKIIVNTVGISGAAANSDLVVNNVVVDMNVANTYNGPTTIQNGGVLNIGVANGLPTANGRSAIIMDNVGTGSTLNINGTTANPGGTNQSVASLTGTSTTSTINLGINTLTIGAAAGTTTFAGTINGNGLTSLIKDGNSTQILSGNVNVVGQTVIQAGNLQITGTLNGASQVVINPGAFFDINLANGATMQNGILNNGTVRGINAAGNTQTVTGVITGIGNFIQNGGRTILSNINSYQGGTQVTGATSVVQVGTSGQGGLLGTGTVGLDTGGTLDVVNANGSTLSNNITNGVGGVGTVLSTATGSNTLTGTITNGAAGTVQVSVTGTGTLVLGNSGNTYTGPTNVTNGTLQVGTAALVGSIGATSAVDVRTGGRLLLVNAVGNTFTNNVTNGAAGSGTVEVNSANTNTLSGIVSDGAGTLALTQSGTGTTILTGANTYSGQTSINAGVLQVGNGGVAGQLGSGNVVNNAVLTFNRSDLLTVNNVISGSGVVNQGVVAGPSTGITVLGGANSYTGQTNVLVGTLRIANATALGTVAAGTVVANGATLDLFGQTVGNEALNIQGVGVGGLGALQNTSATNSSISGPVTLAADTTIGGSAGSITLSGNITGNAALTKIGTNLLLLTGNNNYTGLTTINNGFLTAGSNNALGTPGAGTVVNIGGTLSLANGVTITGEPLTLNGNGFGGFGALTLSAAGDVATYAGAITVATNSLIDAFGGGTLNLTGGIDKTDVVLTLTSSGVGGGIINVNSAITGDADGLFNDDLVVNGVTTNLNAANSYAGPTFITSNATVGGVGGGDGILNANVAGALPTGTRTTIVMDNAGVGGSVLNLNGGVGQAVQALIGANALSSVNLNGNTLTIGFSGVPVAPTVTPATFAGVISGTGNIIKDGTSVQIFGGAGSTGNTYTGTTAVQDGTLQAGVATNGGNTAGAFGVNSNTTVGTTGTVATLALAGFNNTIGSLSGNANGIVQNGAAGTATLTTGSGIVAPTITTFAGLLQNGGVGSVFAITKVGTGTQILSGANTYTGATTVNAGILQAGVASVPVTPALPVVSGAFGVNSAVTVNGGALDLAGFSNTIGSLAGAGGFVQSTLGVATLATGSDGTSTSYTGIVQDGAGGILSFTKVGAGTQILGGINTYTGATTVLAGTLQAGSNQAFGVNSATTVANGAFLELAGFSNTIGSLSDGGVFPATGIVQNTLATGGNNPTVLTIAGTSAAAVGFGGTINQAGAGAPLAVVINGGLAPVAGGAGTQSLSGQSNYSGGTTLNSGSLDIDATGVGIGQGVAAVTGPLGTGQLTINGGDIGTGVGSGGANVNNAIGNVVQVNGNFTVSNVVLPVATLGAPSVNAAAPAAGAAVINTYTPFGPNGFVSDGVTFTNTVTLNTVGGTTITTNSGFLDLTGTITETPLAKAAGGGLTFAGNTFTYIGSAAGGAALGIPTLPAQVDAANTYTGLTTVAGGFVLLGKNAVNAWAIPGNLSISPGAYVQFDSGGGAVANQININSSAVVNGTLDTAGLNQTLNNLTGGGTVRLDNSAYNSPAAGTLAGILTLSSGNFSGAIVDGGLGGQLVKNGPGTLILTGNNTYVGNTTINGGVLAVNGTTTSANTFVNPGATLQGVGRIGGNVLNNGTVSPGNSVGTLTVSGNYKQTSNGNLVIEVAGGKSGQYDVLAVGGNAQLDGTLRIVKVGGARLKVGDKVKFLTAAGGVTGKFSKEINPFSTGTILNAQVVYNPKDVTLQLTQGSYAAFARRQGLTINQRNTAAALDSAAGDSRARKMFAYLNNRPLANLPNDFDLIAPDEIASVYETGVSLATVQSLNLQRRTADVRAGSSGFSASGLQAAGSGPLYSGHLGVAGPTGNEGKDSKFVAAEDPRIGVFLTGIGEWVDVDGDGNARGYDLQTGGFTLGLDYRVNENFLIGVTAGYANTGADLTQNGDISVNGGKLGVYASYYTGGFYVDAAVIGGLNSYDTSRGALQGKANGSTDGGELNVLVGTGYEYKVGGLTVGPTASFQYTYVGIDGFTETGSLAPLTYGDQSGESMRTTLGFKASYDWRVGGVIVKPEFRAAWQHEFGDDTYAIDSSFANGAGNTFTVFGPQIGRDSALLGAGVALLWNERTSTYVYYDGQFGRTRYQSNAVSGGVKLAF